MTYNQFGPISEVKNSKICDFFEKNFKKNFFRYFLSKNQFFCLRNRFYDIFSH